MKMTFEKHIFMIAGEASGDLLGARLMGALQAEKLDLLFSGIGGDMMARHGLKSIFPMEDLSVMGLAEVLPKLSVLYARIIETSDKILRENPDVVVSIDAPDFCFRVIKRLRRKGYQGKCVHYVAPSVWAWRPGRAKKVAKFLDHLLCLLPFEPPYFEKHGLPATFVGHSIIESHLPTDGSLFREMYDVPADKRIILLLPGSRSGEIDRHLSLFVKTAEALSVMHDDLLFVLPTLPHLKARIEGEIENKAAKIIVIDNESAKSNAFNAADFAIAASGTVALELALADVPSLISYRMNFLTGLIAKKLVKTDHVALPNIILGEEVMPELLLSAAKEENLIHITDSYLSNPTFPAMQKQKFRQIRERITPEKGMQPSEKAAKIILEIL